MKEELERTIITKFRKTIWRPFSKAVRDYNLIDEGDKIAVCISGGKDSFLLAKLMQEIKRHGTKKFDLVFIVMNPGYEDKNINLIKENAKNNDVGLMILPGVETSKWDEIIKFVEKYDINVIAFINIVDGRKVPGFESGLSLEEERARGKEYYDAIRGGAEVKTSLINSEEFREHFEPVLKEGKDLLYISLRMFYVCIL